MFKPTKTQYAFRGKIAKILSMTGMAAVAIAPVMPALSPANAETNQMQKPALLALAENQYFAIYSSQPTEEIFDLSFLNGSTLISQGSTENVSKSLPKTNINTVKHRVIVTAYSSTADQTDSSPFVTAMGSHVRDGIVACNFLKFGTKVRLPEMFGNKIFVVEDRMAKKNSHKMDIWMTSREQALQFGVRLLNIEVLE